MHQTNVQMSEPKLRLIEAAEALFADRGFDTVSVRDITKLAKANVASINYHFGSRDGLLAVVLTRYIAPVNEERLLRLDQAEKTHGNKPVPLEVIVDAFARPLVTQVRKSELSERLFYKLLGRSFAQQDETLPPELETQFRVIISRFIRTLAKTLPGVPSEELIWRLHFVAGAMVHMLTHGDCIQHLTQGSSGTPTMDTTISRFIRFSAAGLREGLEAPPQETKGPQGLLFDF